MFRTEKMSQATSDLEVHLLVCSQAGKNNSLMKDSAAALSRSKNFGEKRAFLAVWVWALDQTAKR